MHREVRIFGAEEALNRLREPWDALPSRRGVHADLYDTATWLASWLAVTPPHTTSRLRIPVVFEEDRLAGVMPLLEGRFGRWTIPAMGYRPRYRIVTGQERPAESTIAALIEGATRAGAKEFQFLALPSHDPQTEILQQVLMSTGHDLTVSEGTTECLAPAGSNWEEHSRGYREIRRTCRKRRRKAETLGEVRITAYGGGDGDVSEGMDIYAAVHARSWKGPLRKNTLEHRRALVEQAQSRGWVRLFVLELAGIPAAAHIWFNVGRRAISYSTVYDQRLATLSLGTVIQWETHEDAFTDDPPLMIDYLPGKGTYKDRLGRIKPRLLVLRARRRSLIGRLTFPVQRAARHTARSARRIGSKIGWREKPVVQPRRAERVSEVIYRTGGTLAASPLLEIRPPLDLLLAVAGGHASPKAMRETWEAGEGWWLVGSPPVAVIRLGPSEEGSHQPVREVVFLAGERLPLQEVLASLARHCGTPLAAMVSNPQGDQSALALQVIHSLLPWPATLPLPGPAPTVPSSDHC